MNLRNVVRILIVAVAAVGAVAAATSAVAFQGAQAEQRPADPALARVSAAGTPVQLPARVREKLHLNAYSEISLLATSGTRHFYRFDRGGERPCFGTGRTDALYPIGMITCRFAAPFFPSAEMPILDLSVVAIDSESGPRFVRVSGFAADGVKRVGVLGADGEIVAEIPVRRNVYYTASPPPNAAALVALAVDGTIVASVPM